MAPIVITAFIIAIIIVIIEYGIKKIFGVDRKVRNLKRAIEENNKALDRFDDTTIKKLGQKIKDKMGDKDYDQN